VSVTVGQVDYIDFPNIDDENAGKVTVTVTLTGIPHITTINKSYYKLSPPLTDFTSVAGSPYTLSV